MLDQRWRRWDDVVQMLYKCFVFQERDVSLTLCLLITTIVVFNPLTAKLFNLNFHPLEVVSRWRDPQLQVSENYSDLAK